MQQPSDWHCETRGVRGLALTLRKSEQLARMLLMTQQNGSAQRAATARRVKLMNNALHHTLLAAALALVSNSLLAGSADAQVAGSTTIGLAVAEVTEVAQGWSAKKSILGKAIYNEAGDKVGVIEDLIVAPNKSLSCVIVGAGGFVGIGRHDVAVPVSQLQEKDGRFVLPGATKAAVKAMPQFEYATDTSERTQFVAQAEQDVAKAKTKLAELQKNSIDATTAAKATLEQEVNALKKDLKATEDKIAEMNRAGAKHWKNFEGDVSAATARLRKWFSSSAS